MHLSSIEGNGQSLDGGSMFGNAPRVVWEKWIQPDSLGRIPMACRGLLIEFENRKILCETGIGQFFDPKMRERFAVSGQGHQLILNLEKIGIDPGSITDVILTHLHFDHAGGMLSAFEEGELRLVFPNAKIFVGEEAWSRAKNPHSRDRASFIPTLNQLLDNSKNLRVVKKGQTQHPELPAFISFRYSDGHTPGHMHTVLEGKGKRKLIFAGDLMPGIPWVHVPITMGYDRFPEKLIDEKESLLKEWITNPENLVFFTHDPTTVAAQIAFEGGKYKAIKTFNSFKALEF